jgi:polyhydroxyalkanoate synthesis regulator phasin
MNISIQISQQGEISMNKKHIIVALSALALLTLLIAAPAFAATTDLLTTTSAATLTTDPPPTTDAEPVDWIDIVLGKLNMSDDALFTAWSNGQSLKDIARSQDVDPQVIADAIVAAETIWLDAMVASGEFSADDAASWKADLAADVDAFMNEKGDAEVYDTFDGVDWIAILLKTLDMEEGALFDAIADGKTVAELATNKNIDPQRIADAIAMAETEWLDKMVADGKISAEEAESWKSELNDAIQSFLTEDWSLSVDEIVPADFVGIDWFTVAAQTLGLDEETLFEAMDSGKSLNELAREQNIKPQKVADAILAAEYAQLDAWVKNGDMPADEVAQWKEVLPDEVAAFMEENFAAEEDFIEDSVDWLAIAQEKLGMDDEAFFNALDADQSLAQIAASQDVASQSIADAIVAAENAWLNKMVADGKLTAEEVSEWQADLAEMVDTFMNSHWFSEQPW